MTDPADLKVCYHFADTISAKKGKRVPNRVASPIFRGSLTKRGSYNKKSAWRDYSADCKNGNNRNNHEQNDA
ncbi:MAG: hypothetical protein AUI45_08630 [Acidobacteria bacterium 13_1_40CM_2_56_11]|nr:MAG: hypothetical protein AUI45_08630 [Acidobacteria bacterium 13_1_40CM_2_56_11]